MISQLKIKAEQSAEIEKLTQEFLTKGGDIKVYGYTEPKANSNPNRRYISKYETQINAALKAIAAGEDISEASKLLKDKES